MPLRCCAARRARCFWLSRKPTQAGWTYTAGTAGTGSSSGPRDVYRLSEQGEIRWHYRHRAWRKTVDEPGALFNAMAMPNERTAIFLHSAVTGSAQVMELDRDGRLAEKSSWMAATREPPVFLPVPEGFWAETWLPVMDRPEETSFQRLHISNAGSLLERQEIRVSAGHPGVCRASAG